MGRIQMEFLQISLGNVLTILSFIFGGIWFISTMRNAIQLIDLRLVQLEKSNSSQIDELKKLGQILVTLGKYEERFLRVEREMDDIRHGRGFIFDQQGRIGPNL